jgi:hypothetical protein
MTGDTERPQAVVPAEQLRMWARSLRDAADILNPPHEVAATDQLAAALPDKPTLEELVELTRTLGGTRWAEASGLRLIASDMESRATGASFKR